MSHWIYHFKALDAQSSKAQYLVYNDGKRIKNDGFKITNDALFFC